MSMRSCECCDKNVAFGVRSVVQGFINHMRGVFIDETQMTDAVQIIQKRQFVEMLHITANKFNLRQIFKLIKLAPVVKTFL